MRYVENYPQFCEFEDVDKFLKDVEAYFTELGFQTFRMKEYVDMAKLENTEGDDVDCCVGSKFILAGPNSSALSEEVKTFILRKLEAIFNKKGASCREIPNKEDDFGKTYHYEFSIYISYL